jgi:hypothetical protein
MRDRFLNSPAAITVAAVAAVALPGTQTSAQGPTSASVPDFSGIWTHPYFGIGAPLSGPGPVTRRPGRLLVGDYTNPILKPEAAEAVRKHGEIELSVVPLRTRVTSVGLKGCPSLFAIRDCRCFSNRTRSRSFTMRTI